MSDPIGEPAYDIADTIAIQQGSAEPASGAPEPAEQPIAVLWVPDIDAPHKWREYHIRKIAAKPAARPFGFRKAGAK